MSDGEAGEGARSVVVRRTVAATAEALFDAWTDGNSFATWMVPPGIRSTHARIDARVGGRYELTMHGTGSALQQEGVYREIERPRRLALTWISPATHFRESVVTVELHSRDETTGIVVTHDGLPDATSQQAHAAGWTEVLAKLEQFVARQA